MKAFLAAVIISLGFAVVSHGQGGGDWQALALMPTARQEIASAVLNGKIYVIGGYNKDGFSTDTVEVYNPATNTWATAHPIPLATNHNSAATAAGKLFVFGGTGRRTFLYDPASDSWSDVALSNFQHGSTAAVGVINDKIYVAGGAGSAGTTQAELEVYDPVANTWTVLQSMAIPRNHTGGAVIGDKFYVVAGRASAGAETALEVYNPPTNSWSTLAPMPTGRSGVGVAAVNGELWVFGGEAIFRGDVEAYNPVSNTWRTLPLMPVPRHGMWASVIGNKIYLPGGATAQNFQASSWNDVFIVDRKATFANISTRLKVETGDNVLIGGFIITGDAPKRVILRAIGPSLPISGVLANPRLELYNGAGQLIAANDNWQDAPNEQEIIDSSIPPSDDLEAAILTTVAPGSYTTIVRGENDSTGVGLVEVYDLEAGADTRLANISTRGFVQTGDNVLIGGLILTGHDPRKVLLRAIGPSLARPDGLADPTLELRDANGGLLDSNDNWIDSPQKQAIIDTTIPPSNDLESAVLQTLPPANYTAIVRGQNAVIGIALVEAYALE